MTSIGRRGFTIGATGALLGAHAASAQDLPANERELYDAAKREGEVTWYSAQIQAEPGEAVGRAFTARYPGIKVNVVRSTSQVAYQRLSQDIRAGVALCDVFSSTDYGHYLFLKEVGKLLSFRPKNADGLLPVVRNADADNMWQIFTVGLYPMGHNTLKVSAADAPQSWQDTLNPKWKNQLAIGHPGYSGAIGILAVALRKMYGWDYFKKLEANKPQIGRSADDPVTLMNAGERNVGLGISVATTLLSMSRGNPLKLIYPTDGTLAVYGPSAIPKNAPHPNAAKLFMEFCTGTGYPTAVRPFFAHSLNPAVPPPDGAVALEQMKLISVPPKEIEAGVPEVKELWRDTFGV